VENDTFTRLAWSSGPNVTVVGAAAGVAIDLGWFPRGDRLARAVGSVGGELWDIPDPDAQECVG
jgi:hypothetical protein